MQALCPVPPWPRTLAHANPYPGPNLIPWPVLTLYPYTSLVSMQAYACLIPRQMLALYQGVRLSHTHARTSFIPSPALALYPCPH